MLPLNRLVQSHTTIHGNNAGYCWYFVIILYPFSFPVLNSILYSSMTYEEALKYMFDKLPMYQRVGAAAYKADLKTTLALSELLGDPHHHFSAIHIAGTNGKGSTAHLIASVLQARGIKTGLYTSPHMIDFRERIKINGKKISRSAVIRFIRYFQKDFEHIKPSFFEMSFAMAMRYFKEEKVDVAVLETGMGGRLDSTNIVHPLVAVITNIGIDHTRFLGTSPEMIATEKAGVIKNGIPVVVGKHQPETDEILCYKAELEDTRIVFADDTYAVENLKETGATNVKLMMDITKNGKTFIANMRCTLLGHYQAENIVTTMQIIEELIKLGFDIRKNHIIKGLNDVVRSTGLLGRWQILGRSPLTIADTGHNEDGFKAITRQLEHINYHTLHFVIGMVNDKDTPKLMSLLPENAQYYFCKADIPRGLPADILAWQGAKHRCEGDIYDSVVQAYQTAMANAKDEDVVFIGGSTFVVAEVLDFLQK